MTDHSLNETLDFFKHVVKVHNGPNLFEYQSLKPKKVIRRRA